MYIRSGSGLPCTSHSLTWEMPLPSVVVVALAAPLNVIVTPDSPGPPLVTVPEAVYEVWANAAVTVVLAFIVTAHAPVPAHPPPDQPLKVEPPAAAAAKLTVEPDE